MRSGIRSSFCSQEFGRHFSLSLFFLILFAVPRRLRVDNEEDSLFTADHIRFDNTLARLWLLAKNRHEYQLHKVCGVQYDSTARSTII